LATRSNIAKRTTRPSAAGTSTKSSHKRWKCAQEPLPNLSDEELIPEGEMIDRFLKELENINNKYRNDEVLKRWLSISKNIGKNPLGEWGHSAFTER
jgi:hypothetical protein